MFKAVSKTLSSGKQKWKNLPNKKVANNYDLWQWISQLFLNNFRMRAVFTLDNKGPSQKALGDATRSKSERRDKAHKKHKFHAEYAFLFNFQHSIHGVESNDLCFAFCLRRFAVDK